jgi:LacI family transcriptional regulator
MARSSRSREAEDRPHKPVTLQQVADRAGVSIATASRVLHGADGRMVGAELSRRVRAAAAELGYVPNAPAQALRRSRSSVVGLIVHDVGDPYYGAITTGVMRVARERDLTVMLAATFQDPELELDYLLRVRNQRAHAVVLAGSGRGDEDFRRRLGEQVAAFTDDGGRVVCVGDHGVDADTVVLDDQGGAERATAHLWQLGHRRIGILTGPPHHATAERRLHGVHRALAARGAELPAAAVAVVDSFGDPFGDPLGDGARAATRELFARRPDLTAVLALSDGLAAGALTALQDDLGKSVPADVSVVGFGDLPFTGHLHPALTTVRLPLEKAGIRATELILDERDHRSTRRTVELEAELTLRDSTGPARD